jgi:hypothetical protein
MFLYFLLLVCTLAEFTVRTCGAATSRNYFSSVLIKPNINNSYDFLHRITLHKIANYPDPVDAIFYFPVSLLPLKYVDYTMAAVPNIFPLGSMYATKIKHSTIFYTYNNMETAYNVLFSSDVSPIFNLLSMFNNHSDISIVGNKDGSGWTSYFDDPEIFKDLNQDNSLVFRCDESGLYPTSQTSDHPWEYCFIPGKINFKPTMGNIWENISIQLLPPPHDRFIYLSSDLFFDYEFDKISVDDDSDDFSRFAWSDTRLQYFKEPIRLALKQCHAYPEYGNSFQGCKDLSITIDDQLYRWTSIVHIANGFPPRTVALGTTLAKLAVNYHTNGTKRLDYLFLRVGTAMQIMEIITVNDIAILLGFFILIFYLIVYRAIKTKLRSDVLLMEMLTTICSAMLIVLIIFFSDTTLSPYGITFIRKYMFGTEYLGETISLVFAVYMPFATIVIMTLVILVRNFRKLVLLKTVPEVEEKREYIEENKRIMVFMLPILALSLALYDMIVTPLGFLTLGIFGFIFTLLSIKLMKTAEHKRWQWLILTFLCLEISFFLFFYPFTCNLTKRKREPVAYFLIAFIFMSIICLLSKGKDLV